MTVTQGYGDVLVLVCMFFQWAKTFSCWQTTSLAETKILRGRIIPTGGIPVKVHNY